jgi:hypothetical protein
MRRVFGLAAPSSQRELPVMRRNSSQEEIYTWVLGDSTEVQLAIDKIRFLQGALRLVNAPRTHSATETRQAFVWMRLECNPPNMRASGTLR